MVLARLQWSLLCPLLWRLVYFIVSISFDASHSKLCLEFSKAFTQMLLLGGALYVMDKDPTVPDESFEMSKEERAAMDEVPLLLPSTFKFVCADCLRH